jgi:hypothetical protein
MDISLGIMDVPVFYSPLKAVASSSYTHVLLLFLCFLSTYLPPFINQPPSRGLQDGSFIQKTDCNILHVVLDGCETWLSVLREEHADKRIFDVRGEI